MKILLSIPCLFGPDHTEKAIRSVEVEGVELLLVDNGAEESVGDVLNKKWFNTTVIRNAENMYVNYAWQQAVDYFLARSEYSHLIIMNSDLIMQRQWVNVLRNRWQINPDEICLPVILDSFPSEVSTDVLDAEIVTEGTAGVFIAMSRKQAELINPIPHEKIRVWFGDNWIFQTLRANGYETVIPSNLFACHYHNGSQNVQRVKGVSEIIEADKLAWEEIKYTIKKP